MSRRRRRHQERGFTLIELLVTLIITTIGLVGLLSLHVSLSRGNEGQGRAAEAVVVATQTIEGLRSMSPGDMMLELTGSATAAPPSTVTIDTIAGRNGLTYRRTVKVTAVSTTLWRLRVEVGWTDDGATEGDEGGLYDHLMSMELVRSTKEAL